MNRVRAIQKSSRTMTTHWTCSPSHWRRAWASSVSCSVRWAWSHCSNWSRTMTIFWSARNPCPWRIALMVCFRSRSAGKVASLLLSPFRSRVSVSSGVAST